MLVFEFVFVSVFVFVFVLYLYFVFCQKIVEVFVERNGGLQKDDQSVTQALSPNGPPPIS